MSASRLPRVTTEADMDAALADPSRFTAGLREIGERHGFAVDGAEKARSGSMAVFLVGDRVVKLVPAVWSVIFERERAALPAAFGRLSVPTPELLATGGFDGWSYTVMSRLPGVSGGLVWPTLDGAARVALAEDLGRLVASFGRVPVDGLDSIARNAAEFARERAIGGLDFQRRCGVPEIAVAEIAACLEAAAPLIPDARRAFVHGDITSDQLLFEKRLGRFHISGLIDFGDAMVMHPIYELVTPAFLVIGPDRPAMQVFLDAAGAPRDEASMRRLAAWSAMHRFNDLTRYVMPGESFAAMCGRYFDPA